MLDKESVAHEYIPGGLLDHYSISQAYVAKLGFLRFELTESFKERFFSKEQVGGSSVSEFVTELYSLLSKSPHVMDIAPGKDELLNDLEKGRISFAVWPYEAAIALETFLKMRVVMPKRIREQLGIFPWSWNPEEFTVYFDGALFAVYAPVESVPILTDLGQITRDFLRETLSPSN